MVFWFNKFVLASLKSFWREKSKERRLSIIKFILLFNKPMGEFSANTGSFRNIAPLSEAA